MNIFQLTQKIFLGLYQIRIIDDFFDHFIIKLIIENLKNLPFYRTEYDIMGFNKKSGLIHNINLGSSIYTAIERHLKNKKILTDKNKIDRMYYNLFLSGENPHYHTDSEKNNDTTIILYLDNDKIELNAGGNTEFYIGGIIIAIPPVTNRVAIFNSKLKHRATAFTNKDRYTFVIKIVEK